MSLPSADDLFRRTSPAEQAPVEEPLRAVPSPPEEPADEAGDEVGPGEPASRKPSGRVRHDEKMTVYVTSDELLEIEHARLALRSRHALAVDRGRLVREAVSLALADLDEHGESSALVRRLREG